MTPSEYPWKATEGLENGISLLLVVAKHLVYFYLLVTRFSRVDKSLIIKKQHAVETKPKTFCNYLFSTYPKLSEKLAFFIP